MLSTDIAAARRARRTPPSHLTNDAIRAAVRADPSERLPFLCECGRAWVWVTLGEFDRRRRHAQPLRCTPRCPATGVRA